MYFTEAFDDELRKKLTGNEPVKFVFDEIIKILDEYIPNNSGIATDKLATKLELFMVELHMRMSLPKPPSINLDDLGWGE